LIEDMVFALPKSESAELEKNSIDRCHPYYQVELAGSAVVALVAGQRPTQSLQRLGG